MSFMERDQAGEAVVERSPLTSYTFEDAEPGICGRKGIRHVSDCERKASGTVPENYARPGNCICR